MDNILAVLDLVIGGGHWLVIGLLVLTGFAINLLDRVNKQRVGFTYKKMPKLEPVPISTNGKGFWSALWMWISTSREWILVEDFHYTLNGDNLVVPKGFQFDGASVPKSLAVWLSPVGVLLMGALIHDYGYKYETLLKKGKTKKTLGTMKRKEIDAIFRDVCIEVNGFVLLNYLAYYGVRLGGFIAWNKHRKNDDQK